MQSYFSHDSNARNSDKMMQVRMDLGAEGYGIFFMLIERLREEKEYKSTTNYKILEFDLKADSEKIKQVVENYDLFKITEDGKYFYSDSFNDRMEMMDLKSKKLATAGKRGAEKRWGNKLGDSHPIATPKPSYSHPNSPLIAIDGNKIKLNKTKLNKIKQNKIKLNKTTTNNKPVVVSQSNLNEMVEYYKTLFGECNKTIEKDIDRALGLFGRDKVISSFKASVSAKAPYWYMKGIWKNWEDEMNGSDGQGKNEGGGAMVVPMVSWAKKQEGKCLEDFQNTTQRK